MWEVTFKDQIEADTEEEAYKKLLEYLEECVRYEDVTVFNFLEMERIKEKEINCECGLDEKGIWKEKVFDRFGCDCP